MEIRRYDPADLPAILRLCEAEGYPSFPQDPARAGRVLMAPGVTTMVAEEAGRLAGFAQLQSDGEIQAHLSVIVVDPAFRRRHVARDLIEAALKVAGGERIDLITDSADAFYAALPHLKKAGFRLYPFYTGADRHQPGLSWTDGRGQS